MNQEKIRYYASVIERVLNDRNLISGPIPWAAWVAPEFFGTQAYGFQVDLDKVSIKRIEALHNKATIDAISTQLGGLKVGFANSQGLLFIIKEELRSHLLSFPDVINLPEPPDNNYLLPLGITKEGGEIWRSIKETENIIIGGQTQYGKTTEIFSWIQSLTKQHTPAELRFGIVDGKDYEFVPFRGSPYLIGGEPVGDPEQAEELISLVWKEVEKRKRLFKKHKAGSLDMYEKITGKRLPIIILVIDEIKDLIDAGLSTFHLERILQQGVGMGIFAIVGTQSPNSKTIKKTNFNTKMAFKLSNGIESGVIFGTWDAYEILQDCSKGEFVVVGPDLTYAHLKGFYVEKHSPAIETKLSKAERALVAMSLNRFDGYCPIDKMVELIAKEAPSYSGIFTKHYLQKVFSNWEAANLLEPAKRLESGQWLARHVTEELKNLAIHGGVSYRK